MVCCTFACSAQWVEEQTLTKNYKANKFVLDPNEGFGRNKRAMPLKSKEEREAEDGGTYSDDDGECNDDGRSTLSCRTGRVLSASGVDVA
jgi:hypothetical protein